MTLCAEVIQAIRAAIDGDRYVMSPRVRRLKSALAKLDPASAERAVTPFPPPKPSGTPSLVYQRLKWPATAFSAPTVRGELISQS